MQDTTFLFSELLRDPNLTLQRWRQEVIVVMSGLLLSRYTNFDMVVRDHSVHSLR